ncbi:RecBCD enzyme subunit RecC [Buchnera aphidicola (Tuberolachnus salignus)]|uniref:RecBCD enzyme subunit RecC n=1 Tax=Buchnera aphidicola subsp. Tuberolachnus salignus TaxID=98804 RepID=A0A161K9S7_BUCTT|nr:exodeoxyribonuclease V subunit gamma [Buchnera aphidicola]CUR53269.1 RecBCD enzyme subunit RecC [Buchnera aphidicola (Tuberolachnus salignus)]
MLDIYQSNDIKKLFKIICNILKKKKNIFKKEIFLIDDKILKKWIQIYIAKKNKISANIQFFSCQKYLLNILEEKNNCILKKNFSIFNQKDLIWILIILIEKKKIQINFLQNITYEKKIQFCTLLAKTFSQYIFEDPTYIFLFENKDYFNKKNSKKNLQKKIWNILINFITKKHKKFSFSQMLQFFIKNNSLKKKSSKRIFIFSNNIYKPLNIFILMILQKNIFIYLFEYVSIFKKFIWYNKNFQKKIDILSSKYSKNFLFFFWKIQKKFFKKPRKKIFDITNKTILKTIQKKILYYKNTIIPKQKKIINKIDNSIYFFHSCTKRTEVENVFKYLLDQFKKNPFLNPSDILITSLHIKKYFFYINTIFSSNLIKNSFLIYKKNKKFKTQENILFTLKNLLKLPLQEFKYHWVLNLLDLSLIRKKFFIKNNEISKLYALFENIGKYWGFDNEHFKKMSLPNLPFHSWEYFIKRIVVGLFLNTEYGIWSKILPYDVSTIQGRELLGKFINFLYILNNWRKILSKKYMLKNWIKILKKFVNEIFNITFKWKKFFYLICQNFFKNIKMGIFLNYKKKISINFLLKEKFLNLSTIKNYQNFFTGTINFGDLCTSHMLPFKIICILGCQKLIENNLNKKNFLTLFQYNKNIKYDIYKNLKHRNFFFNSVMSAKNILYLSYNIKKKLKKKPIFIEELRKIIKNNFYILKKEKKTSILKKIFFSEKNTSYLQFKKNIFFKKKKDKNLNFNCLKKSICVKKYYTNILYIKDFIQFWKNPIKYFFKNSLKLNFNIHQKNDSHLEEPFLLNSLQKFFINEKTLNALINKKKIPQFENYQKKSVLPNSEIGKIYWKLEQKKINKLFQKIKKKIKKEKKIKIKYLYNKTYLQGTLKNIYNTQIIRWTHTILQPKHIISVWLEHLIYCTMGYRKNSLLYSLKSEILEFKILNSEKAKKYLNQYIQGYYTGIKKPILLLKSGIFWLEFLYSHFKKKKYNKKKIYIQAEKNFFSIWNNNIIFPGEKKDLYIEKIIPHLTSNIFKKIKKTSIYWWSPILKYTQFIKKKLYE